MAEEAPAAPAPVPEKPPAKVPAKVPAKAPARSRGKGSGKGSGGGGAKRNRGPRSARDTPSVGKLIICALTECKERKGCSVPALKKYLASHNVDVAKHNKRINSTLTRMVEAGTLIQVKGNGASGSFKLAKKETQPRVRRRINKEKGTNTPKKSPARKTPGASKVSKKPKGKGKDKTKKSSAKTTGSKSSSQKPTKPTRRASGKTKPDKKNKPVNKKSPARKPPPKRSSGKPAAKKSANRKK